MKCCVEGCEASPAKGDRFYRVKPWPERVWVCGAHLEKVEMTPEMVTMHARYEPFFAEGKKKQ